jgi:hypothetical protein
MVVAQRSSSNAAAFQLTQKPAGLIGRGGPEGGTTSACGSPKRVTSTGFLVRRANFTRGAFSNPA